MNNAISKSLELTDIQRIILCKNITLSNKIKISKTLVDISPLNRDEITSYKSALQRISDKSPIRNMMAHDLFGPENDDAGSVRFLVVKASSKLDVPDEVWPAKRFYDEVMEVDALKIKMHSLCEALSKSSVVAALMYRQSTSPISAPFGIGALGLPAVPGIFGSILPDLKE
ncbi:hypothetical protein [Amorphus coralli]|uniref:hypothetical protein n=1 Tax=Amorphus coralli TaxID=340680 RepID=UPI0012EB7EC3|nr:hypothetical protein [Amorphus coralli]